MATGQLKVIVFFGFVFTQGDRVASCTTGDVVQLSDINGTISSPNYPNQYPTNQLCQWNITVPVGHYVQVKFLHFNLQKNTHVGECDDYVDVLDGSSSDSPLMIRACEDQIPKVQASSSTSVWIKFFMDEAPTSSTGFELQFLAVLDFPSCQIPRVLGMEDGRIPDSRISASSTYNSRHAPHQGRLRYRGGEGRSGSWSSLHKGDEWLQVDLGQMMKVSHIQTQGRHDNPQWIVEFAVSYSHDGETYEHYKDRTGTRKTFAANTDQDTVITQVLSPAIVARFIRIISLKYKSHPSTRLELIGCPVERDCLDLLHRGHVRDGLYVIHSSGGEPFQVSCDLSTNGGGFTVFQRRLEGTVDFNRTWSEYKKGFGDLSGDFWLGNDKLHTLASQSQELLIELEDFEGSTTHASYSSFRIGSEAERYAVRVGKYSGTAGDSLYIDHNGMFFSTKDRDNDNASVNCALDFHGAWWYNNCHRSNLNGRYIEGGNVSYEQGISWQAWKGPRYSLKSATLKIRPLKERDWDYDLNFKSRNTSNSVILPKVTAFKHFTACWWIRSSVHNSWSTVFSLVSTASPLTSAAFSFRRSGHYRLILQGDVSEFSVPAWPISDDYWHHVCITWTSTKGEWVFYVDGLKRKAGNTQKGVTLEGGILALGQMQIGPRRFGPDSSFTGLLSRLNIWDKFMGDTAVEKIVHACSCESGNVVAWPEVYLRAVGEVEKQPSSLCSFPAIHRWDLSKASEKGEFRDLMSGRDGVVSNNDGEEPKGLLSLQNGDFASVQFRGSCVSNPSLCEHGLSLSFWLRHKPLLASRILGSDIKLNNQLKEWLSERTSPEAVWIRCYRADMDRHPNFQDFHKTCDVRGPTITLIRVERYIFGGFLDNQWGGPRRYLGGHSSFIFSLINSENMAPFKMNLRNEKRAQAALTDPEQGPIFGDNDIHIAGSSAMSYSDLSNSYQVVPAQSEVRNLLAGSFRFRPDDLEVFSFYVHNEAVGVADSHQIPDERLSASSVFEDAQSPYRPELADVSKNGSWCSYYNDLNQWLQLDLGQRVQLHSLRTLATQDKSGKVTRYHIQTKMDDGAASQWEDKEEVDYPGTYTFELAQPTWRFIRLLPREWENRICMRVEISYNTSDGLANNSVSRWSASSWGCMTPPYLARLHESLGCHASWCAQLPNLWMYSVHWQVDIGREARFSHVATQGAPDQFGFVKTYMLKRKADGEVSFSWYSERGENKVFEGNWDHLTVVKNAILVPFRARHIQILPQSCEPNHRCCLRVELYEVKEGHCPKNWRYFQGSCYYFSADKVSMTRAQDFCEQEGASLVKVTSEAERDFTQQHMIPFSWIGLVRNPMNAEQMVWLDGSTLTHDWSWFNQGSTSRCTAIVPHPCKHLAHLPCDLKLTFICEKDDARHVLSSGSPARAGPGVSFYYHSYSATYKVSLSTQTGHLWEVELPTDVMTESDWYHFTITWSENNGLRLYKQATVVAETIHKTKHDMVVLESNERRLRPLTSLRDNFTLLVIGKDSAPGIADFAVELSDLQIWETVLPEANVKKFYQESIQSNDWILWTNDWTTTLEWQLGGGCADEEQKGGCEKASLPSDRDFRHLGCFLTKNSNAHIPILEKLDSSLAVNHSLDWRTLSPSLCAQASRTSGFSVFGLRDGGVSCASSIDAHVTYNKYGPSVDCDGRGMGGPNALDVYVLTENLNLALKRETTQSSTEKESSLSVDGRYLLTSDEQFSSTAYEHSPWWRVDLANSKLVAEVVLYFPSDSTQTRFWKLEIRIGDTTADDGIANPLCRPAVIILSEWKRHVRCTHSRLGRYVTVRRLTAHGKLQLTEVKVLRAVNRGHPQQIDDKENDFKMVFPEPVSVENYARFERDVNLSAFSVCLWTKMSVIDTEATFLSVAANLKGNAILIGLRNQKIRVRMRETRITFKTKITAGQWHHLCITWKQAGGTLNGFLNGEKEQTQLNEKVINDTAVIVIGQQHARFGGPFMKDRSFSGELTQLNMWDYVLEASTVSKMADLMCDAPYVGNCLRWSELRFYIQGDIDIQPLRPAIEDVLASPECRSYASLTNLDRAQTNSNSNSAGCDVGLETGWYRFTGLAGSQMADSCVQEQHCGTHAPGWLNGAHPLVEAGIVSRKVCFSGEDNCCNRTETIKVRNCGSFYVYKLNKVANCPSRYCGAKPVTEDLYKLVFPGQSGSGHVVLERDSLLLTSFTTCMWIRVKQPFVAQQAIFSFVTKPLLGEVQLLYRGSNELMVTLRKQEWFVLLSEQIDDGKWHHVCVLWESVDGSLRVFVQGALKYSVNTGLHEPFDGPATVTFGQPQGNVEPSKSFVGELTQVNMWSFTLSKDTISRMYRICERVAGDVVVWTELKAHARGNVQVVPSSCPSEPVPAMSYVFSEASYPAVTGTLARLDGPYVIETHNCLKFRYHMLGQDTGRLSAFLVQDGDLKTKTLLWRLAGDQGEGWKTAEVPIHVTRSFKIFFESVTGSGYRGDIAVDRITIGVNDDCSLIPRHAQIQIRGFKSFMIGHISSYQDRLKEWMTNSGFGDKYWAPCYRALTDGWSTRAFFQKCSERGPSLTLIRKDSFVFGGFTDKDWKMESTPVMVPSQRSFLFSLSAFGQPNSPRQLHMLSPKRDEAITRTAHKVPYFGGADMEDLSIKLDEALLKINLTNSYESPADPFTFFTGNSETKVDDVEVLVIGDTLCDPPCTSREICDEILGRCICDSTKREEEWCQLRQDQTVLSFDKLLLESLHYWPLDGKEDSRNFKGTTWINRAQLETVERGPRDKAVMIDPLAGPVTLLTDVSLNFGDDVAVAVWVRYERTDSAEPQTFLHAGFQQIKGFRFYQPRGSIEHLSLELTGYSVPGRCKWVFKSPSSVWSHYVFTWKHHTRCTGDIFIYVNGKPVNEFVPEDIPPGNYVHMGNNLVLGTLGSSQLLNAKFDEMALWNRFLTRQDADILYQFYKGFPNLKVFVSMSFPQDEWSDAYKDKESDHYLMAVKNITSSITALYQEGDVRRIDEFTFRRAAGLTVDFTVSLLKTGYKQVEPVENFLQTRMWNSKPFNYSFTVNDISTMTVIAVSYFNATAIQVNFSIPRSPPTGILQSFEVIILRNDSSVNQTEILPYEAEWHQFDGLHPGTTYVTIIKPWYLEGPGKEGRLVVTTAEERPGVSPGNFTLTKKTPTGLSVRWSPIPVEYRNGIILGYLVEYRPSVNPPGMGADNVTIPADKLSAELTDLEVFTYYLLTVRAFTSVGKGPAAVINESTDLQPLDVVPQNITPIASSSTGIALSWQQLSPNETNQQILGYKVIVMDTLRGVNYTYTFNASTSSISLDDYKPYTPYKIKMFAFSRNGVGNTSVAVHVTTEEDAPSSPPRNLTIMKTASGSASLQWLPVDKYHINGKLRLYKVIYFETLKPNQTLKVLNVSTQSKKRTRRELNSHQPFSFELTGLKSFTNYTIRVLAVTVKEGVPTLNMTFKTAEGVPSVPPDNVTAWNTSSSSIIVQWQPIPEHHVNGLLRGYRVYYQRTDTVNASVEFVEVGNNTHSEQLRGLKKYGEYLVRVAAFTIGDGNASKPVSCWTDQDVPDAPPDAIRLRGASTTSMSVRWLSVPREQRNGVILGYQLSLLHDNGSLARQTDIPDAVQLSLHIAGLDVWTNYSIRMRAFTIKGYGPWSKELWASTDEQAPDKAPHNISSTMINSTSILVKWSPVQLPGLKGIFRGYRVYYQETAESLHPITTRNVTVDVQTTEVHLTELHKFTRYRIHVTAFSTRDGVSSDHVFAKTDEDIPDKPPTQIRFSSPRSTAIVVRWRDVPAMHRNGVVLGYRIKYRVAKGNELFTMLTLAPFTERAWITDLEKFKYYTILLMAFTRKGEGSAHNATVRTAQDVPSKPPESVSAASHVSLTTIHVWWQPISVQHVHGILRGYKIKYHTVSIGEEKVQRPRVDEKQVAADTSSTILNNLESYTVYKIEVVAFTDKGNGPPASTTAETCHCKKRLTTSWRPFPPYVIESTNKNKMAGLIPPILQNMVAHCCGSCHSHGKSFIDFKYNGLNKTSKQQLAADLKTRLGNHTDFTFPIYGYAGQERFAKHYGYHGVVESPGIAFVVNTNAEEPMSRKLFKNVIGSWPAILLAFLLTYVAGIVMWLLESRRNTPGFPTLFTAGASEGFYWAFVSMTTVGYGDRAPRSVEGRLVALVIILFGLVMYGLLTANISTSLTKMTIQKNHMVYGTKMAVVAGRPEHRLGIRKNAIYDPGQEYRTIDEIIDALEKQRVRGILIDTYAGGSRWKRLDQPHLRVHRVFGVSSTYGVILAGNSEKLSRCFKGYHLAYAASISHHVEMNTEQLQTNKEPLQVERSTKLFESDSPLFRNVLYLCSGLLALFLVSGLLMECICRIRTRDKVSSEDHYKTKLLEMRNLGTQMYDNVQQIVKDIKVRHQKEMKCLVIRKNYKANGRLARLRVRK